VFTVVCKIRDLCALEHGSPEYLQLFRLMETFTLAEVTHAVEDALHLGTISFDAVKHLRRIERRPLRLDMENYPHPVVFGYSISLFYR
jgi:hypothetical protein